MADNDPNYNDDRDNGRRRGGEPKQAQPPVPAFVVWVIVVCLIVFMFFVFRNNETQTQLKQADFEQALLEQRVKEFEIRVDPSSDAYRVTGVYFPETGSLTETDFSCEVLPSDKFHDYIRMSGADWNVVRVSDLLQQILIFMIPFLIVVLVFYFLFARQLKNAGKGAIQFGKSRAKMIQSLEKVTFADVVGVEEAKEEVEEIIDYLRDPERFHRLGGRIPRGVLMVGPPGTGKTLLARAIAGEADVPFFNISGSDFVEMFVGVGASRVRDMFEQAKKNAPCIIFIDEIDAVGRSRFASGYGGGHDEREQTLNALLVEMDGFENKSGVIVIAATNRADILDPALLRPGRFDRRVEIGLPDLRGRAEILGVHAKKVKMSDVVDLHVIARGTPGLSGADLANLINEAALLAARSNKHAVEMDDLEEARDKVMFGKQLRSRVLTEKERRITAFHEAGHALVGLHSKHATPLHKVTIIPRGQSLGSTMSLPREDQYTHSLNEMKDQLAVLMGGRVAEDMIFGEVTTGAGMDIKQASRMARAMVCNFGMSQDLGPLSYGDRENQFGMGQHEYSEQTAREIDLEVRRMVEGAEARARQILTENQHQLTALGNALLEQETLGAHQVKVLLGMEPPNSPNTDPPDASPTKPDAPNAPGPIDTGSPASDFGPGIAPNPAMRRRDDLD